MTRIATFYYFTVQSHLLCVLGKQGSLYYFSNLQSFELAIQDCHPSLYFIKTWYPLYISDPFWKYTKMLTALFDLV